MAKKSIQLRFRFVDKDIFDAIKNGLKKVETRAATVKFRDIKAGDKVVLACGKERFEKLIKKATIFKNIKDLLKKYKPKQINPQISTPGELEKMYYSFTGYKEKIKKYGLIAIDLK